VGIPTYVGAGDKAEGLGAITVPFPEDVDGNRIVQAGDGCLLIAEGTTPSALTQVPDTDWSMVDNGNTGSETGLLVWQRRYAVGAPEPVVADLGDHAIGIIVAFRGIKASGAWVHALSSVRVQDTVTDNWLANAVVTTVNDCLIVFMSGYSGQNPATSYTNGSLANIASRVATNTALGNTGAVSVGTGELATAGNSGQTASTLAANQRFVSLAIALEGEALATVAKTVEARWNTRAVVAVTRQTLYNLRALIAQSREARWNVLVPIADQVETP
jgi:hypothetical protein